MFSNKINKIGNIVQKLSSSINDAVLSDFLKWFFDLLNIHFYKNKSSLKLNKGDIVFANLGRNIGSELNKNRPCVVYSIKKANFGETVIIIPMKSYKGKLHKDFNVFISSKDVEGLSKDSIIDLSSIRQISKKRVNKRIGKLSKSDISKIDDKLLFILGIKK